LTVEHTHLPVLPLEVVEALNLKTEGIYVDATVGLGGHSEYLLKGIGSEGRLIGIDRDDAALKIAEKRLADKRFILRKGNFSDMENLLDMEGISAVDGVLFDLGVSMLQFRDLARGFSFASDERLDMRMDNRQKLSAWHVVNTYSEKKLNRILWEYGEERLSHKIAAAILRSRNKNTIDTCSELVDIVENVYGGRGRLHPATKTFQALRIEVNKELEQLSLGLEAAQRLLKQGGRFCVISYHSLEDRIAKRFIADSSKRGILKIITKKPVTASPEELRLNPSSRSAKLRAAEKI
jgi:16S rRNA (cytosine1402-N4)-methyltransferase